MSDVNTDAGNVRLVGGRLCLDFVNTVDSHLAPRPKEYLRDYAALLRWARHAGALDDAAAGRLGALAGERPEAARAVLQRARAVRIALFRLFDGAAGAGDLAALNAELALAPARMRLTAAAGGFAWEQPAATALDSPLWPILWSAADLLTSPDLARVRRCAGEGCGWMFLDTSRGGTRRWCSMEDCGNRAKARRHYAQARGPAT